PHPPIQPSIHPPTPSEEPAASAPPCVNRQSKIVNPPFPISPLSTLNPQLSTIPTQPFDHIPVLDSFGAWISWIPRSGKGSVPTFDDAILFENSRGKSVCWINPKWLEQSDPAPDRLVPLLNADGRILQWIPQP